MSRPAEILLVAGARPNFVKAAALERAFSGAGLRVCLVHTGQHYDPGLSGVFFEQLGLPQPDHHLGVGSGPHGGQTGQIMAAFEPVLLEERPRAVVVVGDVNSTLACALVAAKAVFQDGSRPLLAHVEAGLRSFDRSMPEEINRLVTDGVSDLLFVSERSGMDNLLREGLAPEKVFLVGNVMIDTLRRLEPEARRSARAAELGLEGVRFGLVTLHRPTNVDKPESLRRLVAELTRLSRELPLLLAAHPRTQKALAVQGLSGLKPPGPEWAGAGGLALSGPLPYLDFLGLMLRAAVVLTDSGGVQEETTALGVPCLTLRPNTERPVTLSQGTNQLVPRLEDLAPALRRALNGERSGRLPELWDGRAAERVAAILKDRLGV